MLLYQTLCAEVIHLNLTDRTTQYGSPKSRGVRMFRLFVEYYILNICNHLKN